MNTKEFAFIDLCYNAWSRINIKDLKHRKHWEEGRVKGFGVKYDILWIKLNDDEETYLEESINNEDASENIDWKYPDEIEIETKGPEYDSFKIKEGEE